MRKVVYLITHRLPVNLIVVSESEVNFSHFEDTPSCPQLTALSRLPTGHRRIEYDSSKQGKEPTQHAHATSLHGDHPSPNLYKPSDNRM